LLIIQSLHDSKEAEHRAAPEQAFYAALAVSKQQTESGHARTPRDLDVHGVARQYLRLAQQQGLVVRSDRGFYTAADAPVTELHTIAEASKRLTRGVVCPLSALAVSRHRNTEPI
jgi:hypothetical protein